MPLTQKELNQELIILTALAKAFSEQSTLLIGELRHMNNYHFNQAVKEVDMFIKQIESNLPKEYHQHLETVGDIYHNINLEMRRNK